MLVDESQEKKKIRNMVFNKGGIKGEDFGQKGLNLVIKYLSMIMTLWQNPIPMSIGS